MFTAFIIVNKSANERKKGTHAPATPPAPDRAKPRKQTKEEEKNIQQRAPAERADVQERAGKIRPSGGANRLLLGTERTGTVSAITTVCQTAHILSLNPVSLRPLRLQILGATFASSKRSTKWRAVSLSLTAQYKVCLLRELRAFAETAGILVCPVHSATRL